MLARLCVMAAIALLSAGCAYERIIPDDIEAHMLETEEVFLSGDAERLRVRFVSELAAEATDETLGQLFALIPKGKQTAEARWTYVQRFSGTGQAGFTQATRELYFEDTTLIVQQRVTLTDDGLRILWLNVTPVEIPEGHNLEFSFAGATFAHFLAFALLFVLPLATIATIVAVWRTRRLKRPILWTLACLFGLGHLIFNWGTGEFSTDLVQTSANGVTFNIFQIQLLSVAAWKPPASPWIFVFSLPLGAIVFWLQRARGKLRRKDQQLTPAPTA